ncbi:hypothetical protein ABK040_014181 [Willaertia magna]
MADQEHSTQPQTNGTEQEQQKEPKQRNDQENDKEDEYTEDFIELVNLAVKFKEEGNAHYKQRNLQEAFNSYIEVIKINDHVKSKEELLNNVNKEDLNNLYDTVVAAANNISMVFIDVDEYQKAFNFAHFANGVKQNAKSFYLQGKILKECNQPERAILYFNKVLELQPSSKDAEKMIEECQELMEHEKLLRGMNLLRFQERQEDEMLQKAIEESKRVYDEEMKKRVQEEELKKKADEEQDLIRQHFLEEQKKKQEEEEKKRKEEEENAEEEDLEIELDDDDHHAEEKDDHEEIDDDEVSLTESEIALLEEEERVAKEQELEEEEQ